MQKTILISIFLIISCSTRDSELGVPNKDCNPESGGSKIVRFASLDGLITTANLYYNSPESPSIVLCHQAGANKVEYLDIASELQKSGFNCLAIDQRAGADLLLFPNETFKEAKRTNFPTGFIDARQDIIASVNYMHELYNQPVILWGSSYSSSLALDIATWNEKVGAVLAFSPAQYQELGDNYSLADSIKGLSKPCFITSSKQESDSTLLNLVATIDSDLLDHFVPQGEGSHGSASLWKTRPDHEEYWVAVHQFLGNL